MWWRLRRSLEVGEHLPDECLADFLSLLDRSNTLGILLAWSQRVDGQCHVNPRALSHLLCPFERMGYELDKTATKHGRAYARVSWLKRDFIVLRKRAQRHEHHH